MEISPWSWLFSFFSSSRTSVPFNSTYTLQWKATQITRQLNWLWHKGTFLNGYRPRRVKWTSNYFGTFTLSFCLGIPSIAGAFSHHFRSPILPSTFSVSPLPSLFWGCSRTPFLTFISEQNGPNKDNSACMCMNTNASSVSLIWHSEVH